MHCLGYFHNLFDLTQSHPLKLARLNNLLLERSTFDIIRIPKVTRLAKQDNPTKLLGITYWIWKMSRFFFLHGPFAESGLMVKFSLWSYEGVRPKWFARCDCQIFANILRMSKQNRRKTSPQQVGIPRNGLDSERNRNQIMMTLLARCKLWWLSREQLTCS